MKNAFLSIVAGALLGGIYVLYSHKVPTATESAGEGETSARAEPRGAIASEQAIAGFESSGPIIDLDASDGGTDTKTASPRAEVASPPVASGPVAGAPIPIPVPPEVQRLLDEDASIARSHALLESQPYDLPWASDMESQIIAYFAETPEFETPTAHCRFISCEITVVSNENTYNWRRAERDLRRQPWAADLNFAGIKGGTHDGQTAAVWFVWRNLAGVTVPP